jgi:hypothetical protein
MTCWWSEDLRTWRPEDPKTWRLEDLKTWKCGWHFSSDVLDLAFFRSLDIYHWWMDTEQKAKSV